MAHADPVWLAGQPRAAGARRAGRCAGCTSRSWPPIAARCGRCGALAASPGQPAIISRAGWGADESLNRAPPRYADAVHMVFVHHTDTPNGYAAADVPAIIRSIYTYHVRSNGWNDIGYNFLVDAYGRVFEGRAGGIDRPVIGAHTMGFNTGSVGIAVIGNGALAPLTTATRDALTSLIAWRLDLAHVDPLGHATLVSGGNDRYRRGQERDVPRRQRPPRRALDRLPGGAHLCRSRRDRRGGAGDRLAEDRGCERDAARPRRRRGGALVPIAFRARVLGGAGWTVTVLDAHGAPVASGSGSGETVAWNWNGERSDGTPLAPGTKLAYRIEAHDATRRERAAGARVAGRRAGAARRRRRSRSAPAVISPDGDGVDDAAVIGYTLAEPSTVTLEVVGAGRDRRRRRSWPRCALPAGGQSARWGGEGPAGLVADGIYTRAPERDRRARPGRRAQRAR